MPLTYRRPILYELINQPMTTKPLLTSLRQLCVSLFDKHSYFSLVLSLLYGVLFISWEFTDTPTDSIPDLARLFFQWLIVTLSSFPLIYLLGISRCVFTLLTPCLFVLSAIFAYYRHALGVTLTPMLLDLIFSNVNASLALDLITPRLVLSVIAALLLALILIRYRCTFSHTKYCLIKLIATLCLLTLINHSGHLAQAISRRLPYSLFYSSKQYYTQYLKPSQRTPFTNIAHCQTDSLILVVVLGETVRADHLPMNGYHRNTFPLMSSEENLISFPNIYSPAIYTHTSLPVLLTRATDEDDPIAREEQSFIPIFRAAGFETGWLSNQESVRSFSDFMQEADTLVYVNAGKSVYILDKHLDYDLLLPYEAILAQERPRQLLVLHTIGSHWYYGSHTDSVYYEPTLSSKYFDEDNREQLINAYDNTLRTTDKFLHFLLTSLRNRKAILVYISDHGESLGENGRYLHAEDNPPLHHPAFFLWYSDAYASSYPHIVARIKANSQHSYRTQMLFHSLLDLALIRSVYQRPEESIVYPK